METLKEILAFSIGTLTVSGVCIAIITYVSRSVFDRWMDQGIENFKHDLSLEAEKHRSQLAIEAKHNEIKFLKLHEERAEILKALYHKVVSLHLASETLYRFLTGVKEYNEQEAVDAILTIRDGYWDLREFTYYNAIFFEKELYSQIHVLVDSLALSNLAVINKDIETLTIGGLKELYSEEVQEGAGVTVSEVMESFNKMITKNLKVYIEDEFRRILGIENDNVEKKTIMQMTNLEE